MPKRGTKGGQPPEPEPQAGEKLDSGELELSSSDDEEAGISSDDGWAGGLDSEEEPAERDIEQAVLGYMKALDKRRTQRSSGTEPQSDTEEENEDLLSDERWATCLHACTDCLWHCTTACWRHLLTHSHAIRCACYSDEGTEVDKDADDDGPSSTAPGSEGGSQEAGDEPQGQLRRQRQPRPSGTRPEVDAEQEARLARLLAQGRGPGAAEQEGEGSDPASDSSEDERPARNTVGSVPLEWYKAEEHVGYDLDGNKLVRDPAASGTCATGPGGRRRPPAEVGRQAKPPAPVRTPSRRPPLAAAATGAQGRPPGRAAGQGRLIQGLAHHLR